MAGNGIISCISYLMALVKTKKVSKMSHINLKGRLKAANMSVDLFNKMRMFLLLTHDLDSLID